MTTLYLVRHGETVDNANRIMQGQMQGELNERGREQARELRKRMRCEPIDAFVASDLKRAVDTAAIIAEPHGLDIVTTPLLRERDWGSFTGRYIPGLKEEKWPDDIESLDALLERASRFLEYIETKYHGQRVLAVGHGIINKAIQAVYYCLPIDKVERMDNAEVRLLELPASETASAVSTATATVSSAEASTAAASDSAASAE